MTIPFTIPEEKKTLLEQVIKELVQIAHVKAVVLGGSYASGTAHSASDLDIGLYYLEVEPFQIEDIRQAALKFARPGTIPTVTGFYEWGAWVNGGAWIETEVCKVDFLYRNLDQVQKSIADAQQGICQHDFDQQPTHGYYSTGYLAETMICLPLYDPEQWISHLKQSATVYPSMLKASILQNSLWSAEFTLAHARSFAEKGDIYNTVGCLTRTAANLTQALFAINERYFLTDKQVMQTINSFTVVPVDYVKRLELLLAFPGATCEELGETVTLLTALWQEVKALTGGGYQPKY